MTRSMASFLSCCTRRLWLLALATSPAACSEDTPARAPGAAAPAYEIVAAAPSTPNVSLKPSSSKIAPTPGTVLRETELKDKPFVDAKTVTKLAPGTALAILDREGGWLRVNAGGKQGWVRLLHVSTQPPGSGSGSAKEIESAAKIATGRAGAGNVVATSGIRGLNEEQLKTAKPAPEELKKLESYSVSADQARQYARQHKLQARKIDYPPTPQ